MAKKWKKSDDYLIEQYTNKLLKDYKGDDEKERKRQQQRQREQAAQIATGSVTKSSPKTSNSSTSAKKSPYSSSGVSQGASNNTRTTYTPQRGGHIPTTVQNSYGVQRRGTTISGRSSGRGDTSASKQNAFGRVGRTLKGSAKQFAGGHLSSVGSNLQTQEVTARSIYNAKADNRKDDYKLRSRADAEKREQSIQKNINKKEGVDTVKALEWRDRNMRNPLKNFKETAKETANAYKNARADRGEQSYSLRSREDAERTRNSAMQNIGRKEGVDIRNVERPKKERPNEFPEFDGYSPSRELINTGDRLIESGSRDIEKAKEGTGAVGRFLIDATANASQMLGDRAVGLVGDLIVPGMGTALSMGSLMNRAGGTASYEARQKGADPDQQFRYGLGVSLVEGLSEGVFNSVSAFRSTYGKGAFDLADRVSKRTAASNIVRNYFNSPMGRSFIINASRLGAQGLEEGSEEVIADIIEPLLERAITGDSDGIELKQMIYDFMVGAFMGAVPGAVDVGRNVKTDMAIQNAMNEGRLNADDYINRGLVQGRTGQNATNAELLARELQEQKAQGKEVLPSQVRMMMQANAEAESSNTYEFNKRRKEEYAKAVEEGRADTVQARGTYEETKAFNRRVNEETAKGIEQAKEVMGENASEESARAVAKVTVGGAQSEDIDTILLDNDARRAVEELEKISLPEDNREAREVLENLTVNNQITNRDTYLNESHEQIRSEMSKRGGALFDEHYDEAIESLDLPNAPEVYDSIFSRFYSAGTVQDSDFNESYDRIVTNFTDMLGEDESTRVSNFFNKAFAQKIFDRGREAMAIEKARAKSKSESYKASNEEVGFKAVDGAEKYVSERMSGNLDKMAKRLNVPIRLVTSIEGGMAHGKYEGGVIYIAADSNRKFLTIAKHELTHHLKATAFDRYQELEDFVFKKWYNSDAEEMESRIKKVQDLYGCTPEEAREEIIADAAEAFFTDEGAIQDAMTFSEKLGKAISDGIHSLLDTFIYIQDSEDKRRQSTNDGDFLKTLDILRDAEQMWLKALDESANREKGEEGVSADDYANPSEQATTSDVKHSLVTDKEEIQRLNAEPSKKTYRAMALIDGKLYPPMATQVRGKDGKWTLQEGADVGQWLKSDITTDPKMFNSKGQFVLKKDNGDTIPAAYNPYIHSSDTMLNDQFSSAYKRPNIVVVEGEIPRSELLNGKRAEHDLDDGRHIKAKDPTGTIQWKAGVVQGKLTGTRTVFLTNHFKPTRVVPDSEVAKHIQGMVADTDVAIPYNVVTPNLRKELQKLGVKMEQSTNAKYQVDLNAKFSKKDQDYMDAVNRGDMETAQRMVDEEAKKHGYDIKAYHGTGSNFTVFDPELSGRNYKGYSRYGKGLYFSDSKKIAGEWGKGSKVVDAYLKLNRPLMLTTDESKWMSNGELLDEYNRLRKEANSKLKPVDGESAAFLIQMLNGMTNDKGHSTKVLTDAGYDGIVSRQGSETEGYSMEYVAFNPNQIKSADPVTYDENGNVIPLSERFNENNEDIRYSRKDTDGNTLTEAQAEYFKDSKVRDADGNLFVMYHGTNEEFTVFKANEFIGEQSGVSRIKGYFSTSRDYSNIYGKTEPYYLNIKNPLFIPDDWKRLSEWKKWFAKQGIKGIKFDSGIEMDGIKGYGFEDGTKGYALWDLFDSGNYWYGDGNLTEKIENAGYDGIYWNEGEGWNIGNGRFIDGKPLAYMPFNENAIKRTDNLNPTENEDVRYSRKEDQYDILQNANPMLDTYHTGIRSAKDIKNASEVFARKDFSGTPDWTYEDAQKALKNGKITVFSSKPIVNGAFVTPSMMEAESYAGEGNFYQAEVPIEDVAWIDSVEGQYAKVSNEAIQSEPKFSIKLMNHAAAKPVMDEGGKVVGARVFRDKNGDPLLMSGLEVTSETMRLMGKESKIPFVKRFLEKQARFMEKMGEKYTFIGLKDVSNADLEVRRDKNGKPVSIVVSAMVKNGEYPVNFDFSSICKKRQALSKLFEKLSTGENGEFLDSVELSVENLWRINEILSENGFETACLGCFVETKRYGIENWADTFAEKWNKAVLEKNPNAEYFNFASSKDIDFGYVSDEMDRFAENKKDEREKESKRRKKERTSFIKKWLKNNPGESEANAVKAYKQWWKKAYNLKADQYKESWFENPALSNEKAIISLVNSGDKMQKLIRKTDLISPKGLKALMALHPDFYGVLYGHFGSGTPKPMVSFTPYNSEIALLGRQVNPNGGMKRYTPEANATLVNKLVEIGGVRIQSFSDFLIQNTFDYMQMVADMAARNFPAHAYTKEIAFAKIFGLTGIKINLSVMFDVDPDGIAPGLDKDGNYVVADKSRQEREKKNGNHVFAFSISYDEAVELQNSEGYDGNVGIIGVGLSDLHIRKMLNDPDIKMVIPYHSSGMPAVIKQLTKLGADSDYTSTQNTLDISKIERDGVDVTKQYGKDYMLNLYKEKGSWKEAFAQFRKDTEGCTITPVKAFASTGNFPLYTGDPVMSLDATNDPKRTAEYYMGWCIENGHFPLFYQFADEENYYKVLYDFNVYHNDGTYAPQNAVENEYPEDLESVIEQYMKEANDFEQAQMPKWDNVINETKEMLKSNSYKEENGKFSRKESTSSETLSTQNTIAKLEEQVKDLKAEFKRTNLKTANQKDVRVQAGRLIQRHGSNMQTQKSLMDTFNKIFSLYKEKGTDAFDEVYEIARDEAVNIVNNIGVIHNEGAEEYKAIKQYLRETPIQIDDAMKRNITDYNDFRKSNFGRLKLVNGETSNIDNVYMELMELFPEQFTEDYVNPHDQLNHIVDVLDNFAPYYESLDGASEEMQDYVVMIASDIMETAYGLQTKRTFADRMHSKVEKYQEELWLANERTAAERMRGEMDIQKAREEALASRNRALERQRNRYEKKLDTLKEKHQDFKAETRENAEKKRRIKQISNVYKRLLEKLQTPSDTKHLPDGYEPVVSNVLKMFDFTTPGMMRWAGRHGEPTKRYEYMTNLREQLEEMSKQDVPEMEIDPDFIELVKELRADINNNQRLVDLDSSTLEDIATLFRAFEHQINTYNKAFDEANKKAISETAHSIFDDLNGMKKSKWKLGIMGRLMTSNFNPSDFFELVGGDIADLYNATRLGFDKYVDRLDNAKTFLQDMVDNKKADKWANHVNTFKTEAGEEIKLTDTQLMSLYCLNKREQAQGHIYVGGISSAPLKVKSRVTIKELEKSRVHPSLEDMGKWLNTLTDEQKKVADNIQRYFVDEVSEWGNETSMKLYNYKKFGEENYFPIQSDSDYMASNFDQRGNDPVLKNMGMTKALTKNASNAIVVDDIFTVYSKHIAQMASYNAYVPAITDFQRVWNYTEGNKEDMVKARFKGIYGDKAADYIENFFKNLNGVYKANFDPTILDKGLGLFKKAAVGGNIRVLVQQPTAIARASLIINPAYLTAAMPLATAHPKRTFKEMMDHCPIARWKTWGFYSSDITSASRDLKNIMIGKDALTDKIFMDMYGTADNVTWTVIFKACELQVEAQNKGLEKGSDEYWAKVSELASKVFDRTQVVDSPFHRSEIMKSQNGITKMATAFLAEPTKTINMLNTELTKAGIELKNGHPARATGIFVRVGAVITANAAALAVAQAMVDAMRHAGGDDDKDKGDYKERFKNYWKADFKDNLNPLGMIPYVKDVWSQWQGYDVLRMDMTGVSKVVQSIQYLQKYYDDPAASKYSAQEEWTNLALSTMYAVGVPISNAKRDIEGLYVSIMEGTGHPEVFFRQAKRKYQLNDKTKGSFTDMYYDALQRGDRKTANEIYRFLIQGGITEKYIKQRKRTWDKHQSEE